MGSKINDFQNWVSDKTIEFDNDFLSQKNVITEKEKKLIITHLWVSGFGWESTILLEEDFAKVEKINNHGELLFLATQENKVIQILKGYYEPLN